MARNINPAEGILRTIPAPGDPAMYAHDRAGDIAPIPTDFPSQTPKGWRGECTHHIGAALL